MYTVTRNVYSYVFKKGCRLHQASRCYKHGCFSQARSLRGHMVLQQLRDLGVARLAEQLNNARGERRSRRLALNKAARIVHEAEGESNANFRESSCLADASSAATYLSNR